MGVIGGVLSSDAISWLPLCMTPIVAILQYEVHLDSSGKLDT